MELNLIVGFSMLVFLNAMSPGANLALIAHSMSRSGSAHAYSNVLGFSFGWLLHGALLGFGISKMIVDSESVFMGIRFLGATYLCWLGAKALTSAWKGKQIFKTTERNTRHTTYAVGCREGFITGSINPQTFLFCLAVFPQFIPEEFSSQPIMLVLVLIFLSVSVSCFCFLVWLFGSFKRLSSNPTFARCVGVISGISLISIGVMFAATAA